MTCSASIPRPRRRRPSPRIRRGRSRPRRGPSAPGRARAGWRPRPRRGPPPSRPASCAPAPSASRRRPASARSGSTGRRRRAPRRGRLGEAEEQRVDGRLHPLVLVDLDARLPSGGTSGSGPVLGDPQDPLDRRHSQPLDRRHGQVAVEVVAVDRVDVLADPEPRVGEAHRRRAGVRGERLERQRPPARRSARARAAAPLERAPLEPRLDQVMVVVAGDDDQLAVRHRLAQRGDHRRRGLEHLGQRAVAQLEHVAEQDEPVDSVERLEQAARGSPRDAAGRRRCRGRGGGRRRSPCSRRIVAPALRSDGAARPSGRCPDRAATDGRRRPLPARLLGAGARAGERVAVGDRDRRRGRDARPRRRSCGRSRAPRSSGRSSGCSSPRPRRIARAHPLQPGGRARRGQGARLGARRPRLGPAARLRGGAEAGRADRRGAGDPRGDRVAGRRPDLRHRPPDPPDRRPLRRRPRALRAAGDRQAAAPRPPTRSGSSPAGSPS